MNVWNSKEKTPSATASAKAVKSVPSSICRWPGQELLHGEDTPWPSRRILYFHVQRCNQFYSYSGTSNPSTWYGILTSQNHKQVTSISAFSVFALIEASFFCCSDMRFVTNRYLTPSKPSPHKWWRIRATSRQNPLSIKREPQKTWPFNGGIIMFSLGILKVMCLSFCVARKTDLLAQDPPLFGHGRTLSRCGYGPPNLKKNLRYQTNKTCNFTWPSLEVYWYIWYMERCFTMPHPHPG